MGTVSNYVQRKALDRVPTPVLDTVGKALIKGIDLAVEQRWDAALERAADAEGLTLDDQVASVAKGFRRELTSVGAASGAVAAVPGLGTASALGVLGAEVVWFSFRATDVIMTIGALHGRTDATPDERRAWVLAVMAYGENAADEFAALVNEIDPSALARSGAAGAVLAGLLQGDTATVEMLRRVNSTLVSRVATRFGGRRGAVAMGRLLPFGIGAAVGGGANYFLSRSLIKQTRRFFDAYPFAPARGELGAG
ncbi:MAG: hypothetical protein AAF467_21735 [Actinomycetota bacterium]